MAIINYLPYGGVPAPEKIFKFEYTGEAVYSETGNDEWELEFDSSGSFTPYEAATVDIFIVGGGGGGSYGPIGDWTSAGGGGGRIFYQRGITLLANQTYSCVIGAGGLGGTSSAQTGSDGGESTFMKGTTKLYTAPGGSAPAWSSDSTYVKGGNGGSGGAAPLKWSVITENIEAAKRGGENGTAGDYVYSAGATWSDCGHSTWYYKMFENTRKFRSNSGTLYASGGGHGGYDTGTYTIGAGGGGSGAGDGSSVSGTRGSNGSANRGGGGGGGWNSAGGNGGSGVIIIRKAKNFTLTAPTDFQINGKTADQTKVSPLTFTWTQGIISGDDVGPIYHRIAATQGSDYAYGSTITSPFEYDFSYGVSSWTEGDVITYTLYAGNPAVDIDAPATNTVSLTYKDPDTVITAPSSLKIAGSSSHTGETAPLTWTAATVTPSQTITYQIYVNNVLETSTTSTSYTFANLTSTISAQTIKVRAVAEDGTVSSFSNSVTYYYEEAPSTTITAPSSLKINNIAASSSTVCGSSCSLSWSASTANPSQTITYYIYMGGSNVGTTTNTSYSVPNASSYTSETSVYVQAKAADGTWSSSSNTGYFQYAYVSNPSNLRVNGSTSSTSSSCSLTWSAPATVQPSATVNYRIYVNNSSFATTTSTSYSFSSSTISSWTSACTIKVEAYTSYATCPGYSNEVTFTYKPASTNVTVAASKYATTDNSSFANTGGSSCVVGRSTSSTPVGTAMKFNAPSGGWGSYSRAVLHVYRTGGSASATVIVGHLNQAYSAIIYCDKFYYNNYTSQIGTVSVGAASTWFSLDITSYKPSGSGEWGITLTSKNAYATVDGTNAYITLS
jgi:hypothetical protein